MMNRVLVRSALATLLALFGGLFAGFAIGSLINGLPFHTTEATKVAFASFSALASTIAGGLLWGYLLARIHALSERRRMSLAGAFSFCPAIFAAAILLTVLERSLVEQGRLPGLPIHVVFTLLFVPATFIVAAAGGIGMAIGSRNGRQWLRFGAATGGAGALAFLITNLALDTLGWRVGAPGAAEHATMLTTMFLGASAAALLAGGVLGRLLAEVRPSQPQPQLNHSPASSMP
jgi:MFS family permease